MSRLHRAAHTDATVGLAFHKVANLLSPPQSALHPRIALRVLQPSKALFARRGPLAAAAGR
jgi:hypothetical protein